MFSAGINTAINSAIIAITTRSSIKVKPFNLAMTGLLILGEKVFIIQWFLIPVLFAFGFVLYIISQPV
jgi:hypothetical protein